MRSARAQLASSGVCGAGIVGGLSPAKPLRVGTDCAGADAPVWALRQLGISFSHAFASETWLVARELLAANSKPDVVYGDMCGRTENPPPHDVYICGFPCQPFSTLHNKTKLLREPKAKPYRAMLKTIRASRPTLVVLENVPGIMRIFTSLQKRLRALGGIQHGFRKARPAHVR